MTIDLTEALHGLADGRPSDGPPPVDLPRVRSRARRRRAVRIGALGAAGVGAAGVVAFGAMHAAGLRNARADLSVDPAATPSQTAGLRDARADLPVDPTAAPGECGASVAPLLGAPDATLGLVVSSASDPEPWADEPGSGFTPRRLGTFVGRTVHLMVVSSRPDDGAGVPSTELSALKDTLASIEQAYTDRLAARAAGQEVRQTELDDLAASAATMRESVERAGDGADAPPTATARVRVLVTYDDRVVAVASHPREGQSDADAAWDRTTSGLLTEGVPLVLETCAVDGVGGAPLPGGTYGVLVGRDGDGSTGQATGLTGLTGPWTLVVPQSAAVSGLPTGFPSDVVPMPPGRLLTATGDATTGWTVEVEVAGRDALWVAADLLQDVDGAVEDYRDPLGAGLTLPGWTVEVTPVPDDDVTTLVYEVQPG